MAEICGLLDGLPLAIELAAARVALLTPRAMLEALSASRLAVSVGAPRDAPRRQRTLRETIAWSYAALAEDEQRLLRRLSVFVAGFTLEAAHAVCATDGPGTPEVDVPGGLACLSKKSLLWPEETENHTVRYWQLQTIREFGGERLAASGEAEFVREHHARFFLALAEEAEPRLFGPEQNAWLDRLAAEHGNLQLSLEHLRAHGDAVAGLRSAGALRRFWRYAGR